MRQGKKLRVADYVSVYEGDEDRQRHVGTGTIVAIDGDLVTIRRGGTTMTLQVWIGEVIINKIL